MTTYLVTTELKTSWWLKLLRYFRLKNKREEFYLSFVSTPYEKGDILDTGNCKIKIIKQVSV